MRLLVTRPIDDAKRSAALLRAAGHEVLLAPLTRIEPVVAELERGRWDAVLITSANAARAVMGHPRFAELRALPVLCVGARSAEAARMAGFTRVDSADGALDDLVRLIEARFKPGARLLYLAGQDRAGDLAAALGSRGSLVGMVVIYRAVAAAELPAALVEALRAGRLDGALHYSPRSAVTLVRLAGAAGVLNPLISLAHYCLSAEVAAPLREVGAATSVAQRPDEAALLALIS